MKPRTIRSNRSILFLVQILLIILESSFIKAEEIILTQSELKAKYGQGKHDFQKDLRLHLSQKVDQIKIRKNSVLYFSRNDI